MSLPLDSPDYPTAEMVAGWHEFVAEQILGLVPNDHWSTSIAVWFDRWQHQPGLHAPQPCRVHEEDIRMTDSTQSHPGIVEQRLPLGVCWVQPTLCGWTHMKGGDEREQAKARLVDG